MKPVDANLIRAYVDGECSPEEAARVREHLAAHPGHRGLAEFEQRLRQGVKQSMMQAPAAPAALRQAIRKRMVESRPAEPARSSAAPQSASVGSWLVALIERMRQPRPVSVGAMIGVVIVVGAAILFGIFYPQIDSTPRVPRTELIASDPAEYASQEHDRCAQSSEHRAKKLNFCTPHEAALALSEHFDGVSVTIFDLSEAGYVFVGEGRCGVPGSQSSAHLLYERQVEGTYPAKLSIFLARLGDECRPTTGCGKELRAGEWSRSRQGSQCRKRVLQSTDNAMVYYLVTCDERDAEAVAELVGRTLLAKAN